MDSSNLRKLAKEFIFEGIKSENKILIDFVNYIFAYCAELKCTEFEILTNDKLYYTVYNLFESVVLHKKYLINEY